MSSAPPAYRVRAVNPSADAENRIHADDVAQAYGFRGGLVPGVTLWAYMTHPVVAHFGRAFLDCGTMRARFHKPVYEGDTIECTASVEPGADSLRLELCSGGALCADGDAALPAETPPGFTGEEVPEAALPEVRPDAGVDTLTPGTVLGSLRSTFRADRAGEYLDTIAEPLHLYRDDGVAHPGWLVWKANTVLVRNVVLGPWIHVESSAQQHAAVRDGDVVVTRAKVADRFERKGHQFVDLAVLLTVDERPVMSIDHRAIYELRSPS